MSLLTLPIRRHRRTAVAGESEAALIARIRRRQSLLADAKDAELKSRTNDLRESFQQPSRVGNDVLVDAFALIGEAALRTLGIQFYDVQFQSGLALVRGVVAQMQTGEGKTFAAAFPAVVCSLAGRGAHIATSNAYLAERDCQQMTPLYECLGLSAGLTLTQRSQAEKHAAYQCDITYGPGCDFGFDYLRDQVVLRQSPATRLGDDFLSLLRGQRRTNGSTLQRGLATAIVDEIDNVLIDDASSPLVISNFTDRPAPDADAHRAAKLLADQLINGPDFLCDTLTGSMRLTAAGQGRIWENADALPLKSVLRPWQAYVEQALRAKFFFRRDVNYIVREDKVVIVDESTGRIFEERSWRDGLHQAVEARESVKITAEKDSLAYITRQRFFRLYGHLCGMTGTATGSEFEFKQFFRLGVTPIPTHRPNCRDIRRPRYFLNGDAKWAAIVREIESLHAKGQPLLIGTRSIAKSELLADRLRARGIDFQLLNGKQDADEAVIISQAGQVGAVTIATNMAGRGTDIQPHPDALMRGGLHVIATEHHDSTRVDRQLIGRAARQGEVGSGQFFVSADDDLLVRYGDWLRRVMQRANSANGEFNDDYSTPVNKVQLEAERLRFVERRQLFDADQQRDSVMSKLAGSGT